MAGKPYEKLEFTDDFMFCRVMQSNPDLCRELTQLLIGTPVGKIVRIDRQKPIEITADGRGIRLDIYFEDDLRRSYDVEMQNLDIAILPKRTRFYQSLMDYEQLDRGSRFQDLHDSYIIFICQTNLYPDIMNYRYTFEMRCVEYPDLLLRDGAKAVFVCADGNTETAGEDMRAFLYYIKEHVATSNLTSRLSMAIRHGRTRQDWRDDYMFLYERDEMMREEGREEGRLNIILELYKQKMITDEKAAELMGISVEDFLKVLEHRENVPV